jgi:GTP-binding protein HflX
MEKAVLVVVDIGFRSGAWSAGDSLNELALLTESSGAEVAGKVICRRQKPSPALYIGKGKALEIALECQERGIDLVIFNNDLTGSQQKNLEEIVQVKTVDRTQLILDIFARRAKSNEGKIQVELAQLSYLLPRLTGRGIYLSRLGGGIGTRGPGEQKLEMDRRRIRNRITKLKGELLGIAGQRKQKRQNRRKLSLSAVALVGYTNAGKSTLLNKLTESRVYAKNRLFSTLDPTVRKYKLPNNQTIVFIDTVGFINHLPHHLIESFKATLEEVVGADLLIHVVDATCPKLEERKRAVYDVLRELKIEEKPVITALNKTDMIGEEDKVRLKGVYPDAAFISALTGSGFNILTEEIMAHMGSTMTTMNLTLGHSDAKLLNLLHKHAEIISKEYVNDRIHITARMPLELKEKIENKFHAAVKSRSGGPA